MVVTDGSSPPDILRAMERQIRTQKSVKWGTLTVRADETRAPLQVLLDRSGLPVADSDLASLLHLESESRRPSVTALNGFVKASWPSWWGMLQKFVQGAQALDDDQRPTMVLVIDDGCLYRRSVDPQPLIDVISWKGCLDDLDVQVATADILRDTHQYRWERELHLALIVELAQRDLNKADELAKTRLDTLVNTNSAAGGPEEIAIWRAQVKVIFPLLEELRRLLVRDAARYLTADTGMTDSQVKNIQDLDLGKVHYQLREHPHAPHALVDSARVMAKLRNQLAHRRCVPIHSIRSTALRRFLGRVEH